MNFLHKQFINSDLFEISGNDSREIRAAKEENALKQMFKSGLYIEVEIEVSSTAFKFKEIDKRIIKTSLVWDQSGPPSGSVYIPKDCAPEIIAKLEKHPFILSINNIVTEQGKPYFDSIAREVEMLCRSHQEHFG